MSNRKKPWKGRAHGASAELEFELALTGEDRTDRKLFDPRTDRKTQQLCQQVRRALSLALAGECADDVLRELYVESVEPMGNQSQLLVRAVFPASVEIPVWEILARLNDRSPRLRAIIAQSICRKRTPNLSFVVVPQSAHISEGGEL